LPNFYYEAAVSQEQRIESAVHVFKRRGFCRLSDGRARRTSRTPASVPVASLASPTPGLPELGDLSLRTLVRRASE
jgi:hypothetical protein